MKTRRTVHSYSYRKGRKTVKVPTHKRTYDIRTKHAIFIDRYPGDGDKRPVALPTRLRKAPDGSEYTEETWVGVDDKGNPREIGSGYGWKKKDKGYGVTYGPFRKVNARKKAWNAENNRISKHWPMDPPNYRKKKSFGGYPNSFFKTRDHKLLGEVVKDKSTGGIVLVKNYYPRDKTFEVMDKDGFKSLVKRNELDVPKSEKIKSGYKNQGLSVLKDIPTKGDSMEPYSRYQEGGLFGKPGRRMSSRKKRARDAEWEDYNEIGKLKRYGDKRLPIFRRDKKQSDVTKMLDKEFY